MHCRVTSTELCKKDASITYRNFLRRLFENFRLQSSSHLFIKAHFIKYLYFFDELDALEFYTLSTFICIIEKYINID